MLEIAYPADPEPIPATEPVSTSRDARGRFRPGVSGNPAGKRPGTRHAKTILEQAITGEEGHQAARVVIEAAVEGDKASARWLIGRIDGKPKGRFIEFVVDDNGDMTAGLDAAFRGIMDGTVTIDEAWSLMRWVQAYRELVPPRRWMDSPLHDAECETAVAEPGAAPDAGIAAGGDPAVAVATPQRAPTAGDRPPTGLQPANHLHFAGAHPDGGPAAAGAAPPAAGNRAMRRRAAALARAAA